MSSSSPFNPEPGLTPTRLEERLRQAAAAFPYPATPDLASRERQRLAGAPRAASPRRTNRLVFALALLLLVLFALLLVSPVRARILDWIRIGAVQIFLGQPTATPVPAGSPSPGPTPTYLKSALNLAGEMPLAQAQEQAGFPIVLPAYPADLGRPDHTFLQQFNGPVVVLVWTGPDDPARVRLSISEAPSDLRIFEKYDTRSIQETQVGSYHAVWIDGQYVLITRSGDYTMTRLITQGHTLIWSNGKLTFRMETDLDLPEALRVAESIP